MATITATSNSESIVNFASGSYISASTGTDTLNLGFVPRFVEIWNLTDLSKFAKFEAQTGGNTVKQVTAGTLSVATAAITINTDGTVTVDTGANGVGATKTLSFVAFG